MSQFKDIAGFRFVKIGVFYLSNSPKQVKYNGETVNLRLSLELISEDIKKLEESAYLLFADDELMYVGEYSFDLKDRWLRNGDYVWHHKDNEILSNLDNKRNVSIWATLNPYIEIEDGSTINISKSIESEILKKYDLLWNKRGKIRKNESWISKNCLKMSEILDVSHLSITAAKF